MTIISVPIAAVKISDALVAARWGRNCVIAVPSNLGHVGPRNYGREKAAPSDDCNGGDAVTVRSIRCRNHGPRARSELGVSGEVP
jgi:hypothetical protein